MSFIPWFLWPLLILGFLMSVSVIASVLFKECHGWKTYFTLLIAVNILIVCLDFAYVFSLFLWSLNSSNPYRYEMPGSEILILPLTLIPLLIYDLILILPYFFHRHIKSRFNTPPDIVLVTSRFKVTPNTMLILTICLLFILSVIILRIFFIYF
jgi:hypothetical protein